MSVSRHGVPHTAGLELGESHLELARTLLKHIVYYQLIDHTVVALLHLAGGKTVCLERAFASVNSYELCLVCLVGRGRIDVEFSRIGCILATESHFLISSSHVKGILKMELIILSVDIDNTVTTYIYYTKLTTLQEIIGLERINGFKFHHFGDRNHSAIHDTVI